MSGSNRPAASGKKLPTQQSVNAAVKQIRDIMRRSNCAGALQYVPELTWILFLPILDEREAMEANSYDLKAVNPHRVVEEDTRTPEELLDEIEAQQKIIAAAIAELRRL